MHSVSPQVGTTKAQAQPPTMPADYLSEIERLNAQIRLMQIQQEMMQQQLDGRDRNSTPRPNRFFEHQTNSSNRYSPAVNLAFGVLRWLFLFVVGLTIACTVSAAMGAIHLVDMLLKLTELCLVPLTIFTLCVVTIVTIIESLR
ncbi:hypothetical protein [Leptothermofonsia sp. ETS-13]|uniref:hypothetical protein n=1 Tax=Leptothermofonsia sp. ETS-13 TaxID=3035696 RepID=UPI003BA22A5F